MEKIDWLTPHNQYDLIVVGGGVAGLTAGLYGARDGNDTLVLEGIMESSTVTPGGALMLTSEIANFPGTKPQSGADLMETMREQTVEAGATVKTEKVTKIDFSETPGGLHTIHTDDGFDTNKYTAHAVIIATGSVSRWLGVPGEEKNYGKGVSSCATCDAFFFKEKTVAVVGGGDTAVEDALLLTKHSSKVYLLVRGDKLRASSPEAREILNHPQVEILWNTTVSEIIDDGFTISGAKIVTAGEQKHLDLQGVFVAIGSDPATDFLKDSIINLDADGYIPVNNTSTEVTGLENLGVYAAGDVVDRIYRQAVTSAGKAAQASMEARGYLNTLSN